MNRDAREDHTLRNALLLTGGLAAGGVGGLKLAEKAAIKSGKPFRGSDVNKFVKSTAGDAIEKVTGKRPNFTKGADIKTNPKNSAKAAENSVQKIKELEDFLNGLQIDLERYKRANNLTKVHETEKLIGQVKERLVKLKGF